MSYRNRKEKKYAAIYKWKMVFGKLFVVYCNNMRLIGRPLTITWYERRQKKSQNNTRETEE